MRGRGLAFGRPACDETALACASLKQVVGNVCRGRRDLHCPHVSDTRSHACLLMGCFASPRQYCGSIAIIDIAPKGNFMGCLMSSRVLYADVAAFIQVCSVTRAVLPGSEGAFSACRYKYHIQYRKPKISSCWSISRMSDTLKASDHHQSRSYSFWMLLRPFLVRRNHQTPPF